ncbi:MAG: peptide deformylase [bacterium]|nr:peptide deformylase [bacterium]
MYLPIVMDPNPILHKRGRELTLEEIKSTTIQKLAKDMVETMYTKDGAGIAAPQVGHSIRLCVIGKMFNDLDHKKTDLILINPVWTKKSVLKTTDIEGCLSVPKLYGKVKRYKKITVRALDINGKTLNFTANDFFARVVQHEVDHLDGILFVEKATGLMEIEKE